MISPDALEAFAVESEGFARAIAGSADSEIWRDEVFAREVMEERRLRARRLATRARELAGSKLGLTLEWWINESL